MRMIDADALLTEIRKKEAEPNYQHTGEDWCVGLIIAEGLVDEQPTIEPQKWVSCSERLPEEHDSIFSKLYGTEKWRNAMFRRLSRTVIITVEYKDGTRQTAPCHTIDGEWNQSMKGMGKVLAWMPLPDPWKGEEE